jgi:hypothetical protein
VRLAGDGDFSRMPSVRKRLGDDPRSASCGTRGRCEWTGAVGARFMDAIKRARWIAIPGREASC